MIMHGQLLYAHIAQPHSASEALASDMPSSLAGLQDGNITLSILEDQIAPFQSV